MVSPSAKRLAPASLPVVLRAPLQFLYYDMLTDDDGFVDTIRKGGTCLGLVVGCLVPFASLGTYQEAGPSPAMHVYAAGAFTTAAAWISAYLCVRCGSSSWRIDTILSVAFACNIFSIWYSVPTTLDYPFTLVLSLVVVSTGVFNLPARRWWRVYAALPYFWSAYYTSAQPTTDEFDFPVALLDGAVPTNFSLGARLAPYVAIYVFSCVTAMVIYAMHDEYASRIDQSRASARLAAQVSEMLASYDTEHAKDLLAAAAGAFVLPGQDDNASGAPSMPNVSINSVAGDAPDPNPLSNPDFAAVRGADAELIASLETIVSNLEAYRPHLPNWMVDAAIREAGLALDESGHITSSHHRSLSSLDTRSNSSRSRRASSSLGSSVWSATTANTLAPTQHLNAGHAPGERTRSVTVARARVVFRINRVAGSDGAAARAASAFVDIVHAAARHTKAAVHSFIGDTVEVSWNAAAGVVVPATKAVRFLSRVRTRVKALEANAAPAAVSDVGGPTGISSVPVAVSVGGGAIACKARIQMAGSGMQRALMVSVGEANEAALATLASGGLRHGAMLVPATVALEAPDIASCPVATMVEPGSVIDSRANDDAAFAAVHEIFGDKPPDNDAFDSSAAWLFAAAEQPASPPCVVGPAASQSENDICSLVTEAYHAAVAGRDSRAAGRALQRLEPTSLANHRMVARFTEAVREFTVAQHAESRRLHETPEASRGRDMTFTGQLVTSSASSTSATPRLDQLSVARAIALPSVAQVSAAVPH